MIKKSLGFCFLILALCEFSIAKDTTLDVVKKRGKLRCGVNVGVIGFSSPDAKGQWEGIDVDVCRAISSAIFNDPNKVDFVPLSAQQRFTALQSGEIDILSRNTTFTLSRDTKLGLHFAPTIYYDGQGLMVFKKLGVKSISELGGSTICIQPGTTTELNIADYFRLKNMKFKPLVIENLEEIFKAFVAGRCDVLTSDRSQLAALRIKTPNPKLVEILPEVISKEPLAPAVRQGDDLWKNLVTWTIYALIEAEELMIDQKNVESHLKSDDPRIQRFLGKTGGLAEPLGLADQWVVQIIKGVGNYGEIYDRNLGPKTKLGLPRGLNDLWINGGLMYSPPFR